MSALLSKMDKNYKNNSEIKWNFTKFVVDRSGNVVARFEPTAKMEEVDKLFETYLPRPNNNNNNPQERPSLIDTPDFIIVIKTLIGLINKLILDVNLYIIDTKDSLYKINGLYVEINNLVKDVVLIYIKECKSIFNMDLTKNFEEIEKYYKTLDEKSEDKMFKLNKIFTTRENEAEINNLLQFYYTMLCE